MTTIRRLARDGVWVAGGQILSAVGTLVSIRLLTEILRPEVFGFVSLLLAILMLCSGIATAPLLQAILRFYPSSVNGGYADHLKSFAIKKLACLCSVIGVLVAFAWMFCDAHYPSQPWVGLILAATLVIDSFRSMVFSILNAERKQKAMAVWTAIEAWLKPLNAFVFVAIFGKSAESVLFGYMFASGLLLLIFHFILNKTTGSPLLVNFRLTPAPEIRARIFSYALPLAPLALVGWVSAQVDRYILATMLDLHAVGLYAAIYGLVSRPFLLVGTSIELTVRPLYYNAVDRKEFSKARDLERGWLSAIVIFCGFGIVAIGLIHEHLAEIFLAQSYRGISALMQPIATGYMLLVIAQFYERLCYVHDRPLFGVFIQTSGAVASVVITMPLIAKFGTGGAAIAVPIYFLLQMIIAKCLADKARQASAA